MKTFAVVLILGLILGLFTSVFAPAAFADAASDKDREACARAIAADEPFAKKMSEQAADVEAMKARQKLDREAGESRAQQDADSRDQTARQIVLDKRQLILAYAAMWVIAAGFLLFLWLKQSALKTEIITLRRELEAASKEGKP